MSAVFKQIGKLYSEGEVIRPNEKGEDGGEMGQSFVTLKEAVSVCV